MNLSRLPLTIQSRMWDETARLDMMLEEDVSHQSWANIVTPLGPPPNAGIRDVLREITGGD